MINRLLRTSHITPLRNKLTPGLHQLLRLLSTDLVLRRTRQRNIDFPDMHPRSRAIGLVLEFILVVSALGELGELFALDFEVGDDVDEVGRDAFLVGGDEGALAVGDGDDGGAKFHCFERGVLGDIAGAGDGDAFALEGLFASGGVLDHVLDVCVP